MKSNIGMSMPSYKYIVKPSVKNKIGEEERTNFKVSKGCKNLLSFVFRIVIRVRYINGQVGIRAPVHWGHEK